MLDECFDYDDQLRANGHFAAGEALQPAPAARRLAAHGRRRQSGGLAGFASIGSRARVFRASRTPGPAALEW